MATAARQKWTVEAYLEFERSSELRHKYLDGEIFAMVDSNVNHSLIAGSTLATLHEQTRHHSAYVFPNLMRLKVANTGLYTYPDITVVCGTPELEDNVKDTLLNPTLIVEVLSPSTESYDRGTKFQRYRALATLQEYVLISQDSPHIERYVRQDDGQWLLTDAIGLNTTLDLVSVGCTLRLTDVYESISFGDAEPK